MILRTGRIDENVLDRSVRKRLNGCCEDNIPLGNNPADYYSYSETLAVRHADRLSVVGAVNGLAVKGTRPDYIRTDILLPAGTEEEALREIEDDIRAAAESAGVVVTGGHTEVTAAVTRPVIVAGAFGNTPLGIRRAGRRAADIFIAGHIGLSGTYLLAEERREELEQRFPIQMIRRASAMGDELLIRNAVSELAEAAEDSGISETGDQTQGNSAPVMVRISDGGIYAGLWKLAGRLHCGFEVDLTRIPVYQETIEVCNFYGINPYQMSSEGCFLAVVAGEEDDSSALVEKLAARDVYVKRIGRLMTGSDKIIVNGEERQSLNRPAPDSLIPILG